MTYYKKLAVNYIEIFVFNILKQNFNNENKSFDMKGQKKVFYFFNYAKNTNIDKNDLFLEYFFPKSASKTWFRGPPGLNFCTR